MRFGAELLLSSLSFSGASWVGFPQLDGHVGWHKVESFSFLDDRPDFVSANAHCFCDMIMHSCLWAYRLANELPFDDHENLLFVFGVGMPNPDIPVGRQKQYHELRYMINTFLDGCEDDDVHNGVNFIPAKVIRWQLCILRAVLLSDFPAKRPTHFDDDPGIHRLAVGAATWITGLNGCIEHSIFANVAPLTDPFFWQRIRVGAHSGSYTHFAFRPDFGQTLRDNFGTDVSAYDHEEPHEELNADDGSQMASRVLRRWHQHFELDRYRNKSLNSFSEDNMPERYRRCLSVNPTCWTVDELSWQDHGSFVNCMKCCDPNEGPRGDFGCFGPGYEFEACCNTQNVVPVVIDARDKDSLDAVAFKVDVVREIDLSDGVAYTSYPSEWSEVVQNFRDQSHACGDFSSWRKKSEEDLRVEDDALESGRIATWASQINAWAANDELISRQNIFYAADVYVTRRTCVQNERWHSSVPRTMNNSRPDG